MNRNKPLNPPRQSSSLAALLTACFWAAMVTGALLASGPPDVGSGELLVRDAKGDLRQLPLLEIDVSIEVTGTVARTEVRQKFRNPDPDYVDAVYLFPLPESSAIDSLLMIIGDRVIKGEIQEKEQARQTFEKARQEGKKASLLEQSRPNLFRTSVANIGPDQEIEIRIGYQEDLRYDQGRFSLRFPMTYTPRFGPPLETAEAEATDPDQGQGNLIGRPRAFAMRTAPGPRFAQGGPEASVQVTIEPGFPLRRVGSRSHEILSTRAGAARYDVLLKSGRAPADRDFVLEWEPDLCDVPRGSLLLEEWEGEFYGLLMMMPPDPAIGGSEGFSRELIFIVDTSGSMGGQSILQAKAALLSALDQLNPGDFFNLIQFNDRAEALFQSGSREVDAESLSQAERYIRALQADGGTNMFPAVQLAMESPQAPVELRQIVFITDGAVSYEQQLFQYLRSNLGQARLFTVGIGAAPNSHFMRGAAEAGQGTFTYIGSPEEVQEKMRRLFTKLDSPALTDLKVDWGGAEVWPERISDLYFGEPLVVAARLSSVDDIIRIEGRRDDGEIWTEALRVTTVPSGRGIHKLWARKKIEALISSQSEGVPHDEIRMAVLETALIHQLVSAFTSLVAVEQVPTAPGDAASLRVPSQVPAGSVLPMGGTSAPLTALLGLISLLAAFTLWRMGRLT